MRTQDDSSAEEDEEIDDILAKGELTEGALTANVEKEVRRWALGGDDGPMETGPKKVGEKKEKKSEVWGMMGMNEPSIIIRSHNVNFFSFLFVCWCVCFVFVCLFDRDCTTSSSCSEQQIRRRQLLRNTSRM